MCRSDILIHSYIHPIFIHLLTASLLLLTDIFFIIFLRWVSTVCTDRASDWAISLLECPLDKNCMISNSLSVGRYGTLIAVGLFIYMLKERKGNPHSVFFSQLQISQLENDVSKSVHLWFPITNLDIHLRLCNTHF